MYRMMSATLGKKVNIWSDKVMDSPRSRDYEIEPQVMDSPGFPIKSWRPRDFIADSLPTVLLECQTCASDPSSKPEATSFFFAS
jgi:hypothetical protein